MDIAGRYRCAELDAELTVADAGGVLYGGFSGFLGQGRMETLGVGRRRCLGAALPARAGPHATRRLDAGVPARRVGRVSGVEVGCWLARRLVYDRVG